MNSKALRSIAIAITAIMASSAVFATDIIYGFRTVEQIFDTSGTHVLKIDGSNKKLFFNTDSKFQTVAVFFSAECTVDGETFDWVDLRIKIDGTLVKPSNGNKAFCTGRGSAALDEWVSAETHVATETSGAGVHELKVTARLVNWGAGDRFAIDDVSVIVLVEDAAILIK